MTWPEGKSQREPQWDLVLNYYEHYGQDRRGPWISFSGSYDKDYLWSNLRTREVFDARHRRVTGKTKPLLVRGEYREREKQPIFLSDEEVYRASLWKRKCFDAAPKNSSPDYIGTPKDWAFARRLSNLRGKLDPEIEREYRIAKDRLDQAISDYPYMDEFEYINTRGDE